MSRTLAAFTALCLALPFSAEAFTGRNGTRVNPINDSSFEVITRIGGAVDDYWCGASDYARRVLGASWTAQIYLLRGRGPSVTTGRRTAVQFTMDADAAPPEGQGQFQKYSLLNPGSHMSVQGAATFCQISPVWD
ncbi:hypothetical protein [Aquicoccus sp. SU-CL01552]|uniref:hypothetical protein n=1 Tax=Aquicoccus sp. SU-CL01552 TaxID=3127656 RepID=UPI00333FF2FE